MEVITPKLKVPFNINGSSADVVEQDSVEEVVQCVTAIINTPVGFREDQPEYGMEDPTFLEGGVDAEDIEAIVGEWEDRATTMTTSEMDDLVNNVNIEVSEEGLDQ